MRPRTIASFLVALIVVVFVAQGAVAQAPVSQFDAILAKQLVATVSIDAPIIRASTSATVAGTLTTASLVSTSSNLGAASVTGLNNSGLTSTTRLSFAQGEQQTVVAGSTVSTTVGLVQLTAASPLSVGNIYTGTEGQLLTIVNAGTNAITIPDSGLNRLTGAIVLGQYDTLTAIWYNGGWTQIATSNN